MFFFPQIMFHSTGLYSNIDKNARLCLRNFQYIEADTHTAFSAFCRQLSILHGRCNGVRLSPSENKHK